MRFTVQTFRDLDSALFCTQEYSALKFGSRAVAKKFGYQMADKFFRENHEMLTTQRCVVIPSAFNVVEIAATILAQHFMNRLNDLLSREGHGIVEWTTMHRSMSYIQDYATMPKEARAALLAGDTLFINRAFIAGKTLLFVDDVIITGTHEQKVRNFLEGEGLTNPRVFCYYAHYEGEIADIENRLNHSGITDLNDYIALVNEPDHHLVVRAVRFLLDAPAPVLQDALDRLDPVFVERLYFACLAKEYNQIEGYKVNFAAIRARYDLLEMVPEVKVA